MASPVATIATVSTLMEVTLVVLVKPAMKALLPTATMPTNAIATHLPVMLMPNVKTMRVLSLAPATRDGLAME